MQALLDKMRLAAVLVALLLAAGCGGGGGDGGPRPPPPVSTTYADPNVYSSQPNASLSTPNEITAVSRGQLVLGAITLSYTATAGHLTARSLGTGTPQASFFYVAYTLDGAAPATRPVTFFYNGGPGSASVWLHLGSFGPRRLETGMPATTMPTPYALVDNAETLLDVSDLVFVNAVGTGYSQAIAPFTNRDFWGVDLDAAVFRDFVMSYVAANNRQSSPLFLFGESYGGPRTAVLADVLEAAGVSLTGVVLLSPAMDYNNNCGVSSQGMSCANYAPSYGATAAWFQRATPAPTPEALPAFIDEMRVFAGGDFATAVGQWLTLGTPAPAPVLDRLAATTGLPRSTWAAQPNRGPHYYRVNLTPGTLHGRYDTRVTLPNNSPPGQELDPSSAIISTSFSYRITEYLASLGYTTPGPYVMLSNAIENWVFTHDGRAMPDTIPDLASAMSQNPDLRVLALNGYHDIATPFFATEQDLARLGGHPNVTVKNYIGGHMIYLDDDSRRRMRADLGEWYRSALGN